MEKLMRTVMNFKELKLRKDDDFVDRLSRQFTVWLLVLFAMIVSSKQFVGDPMSCWCPAHFTDSHRQYANTMCWISNTFYVPFDADIPDDNEHPWQDHRMISYYQWVPLIMLSMSLMTFIPTFIWRFLNLRSGIDLTALMESADASHRAQYLEIRQKTVRYIVNQVDRYLLHQRDYRRNDCVRWKQIMAKHCFLIGGKTHGNYLMVMYIVVKLCYLANAIGQLFLLDHFLGQDYHVYGIQVLARLMQGEDWTVSDRFPRVTLCSFRIRHQSRIHDYVVQCALSINLFNEKIFIIIWFWFILLAIITLISLCRWIALALYWPAAVHFAKKKLRAFEVTSRSKANLRKFVQYYLRRDGLFILRLISMNVGELEAAECLAALWENYNPEKRQLTDKPPRQKPPRHRKAPSRVPSPSAPPQICIADMV